MANNWGAGSTITDRGGSTAKINDKGFLVNDAGDITYGGNNGKARSVGADGTVYSGGDAFGYIDDTGVIRSGTRAVAPTYTAPVARQVDAKTETIEGRLPGLLASNSPVLQQAQNRTAQQYNARGLLSSRSANQAGQEAVIAKAIEIASPDAATYTKTGMANQSENNQFARAAQQQAYTEKNQIATSLADIRKQSASDAAALERQSASDNSALARQSASDAAALERQKAERSAIDAAAAIERSNVDAYNTSNEYHAGIRSIDANYNNDVNAINNLDINANEKTARIFARTEQKNQSISLLNAASAAMPEWRSEWAVIPAFTPTPTLTPTVIHVSNRQRYKPRTRNDR